MTNSAIDPGHASRAAEDVKRKKYAALAERHHFVPFAVETTGVIGPAATELIRDLGMRIAASVDDPRATSFLFQRVSLAIARGNSFAILASAKS